MTTGLAVDWAHIQARAATDTAQNFAAVTGEHLGATVVDEDDVHVFGAVGLIFALRAADELIVNSELLTGAGAADQIQEHAEVAVSRHDLFDADHGDVHLVGRHAEAGIAFVGNQHEASGLCGDEVGTSEADVSVEIFLAQVRAGAAGDRFRVVVILTADAFALETLGDAAAVFVHDGRDDVGRVVVVDL